METAVILGATGALGRTVSRMLLERGNRIVGVARHTSDDWMPAAEKNARLVVGDVTDQSFAAALARELRSDQAPQVLVHAVGIYEPSSLDEPRTGQHMLETNLVSAALAVGCYGSDMCQRGYGRIVLISSICAMRGSRSPFYAISKAGLRGLVASVAAPYAAQGVTVNLVLPGPVESDMLRSSGEVRRRQYLEDIPCGRLAAPEEVGAVVCFLASKDAAYVTGAEVPVTCGMR